MSKLHAYLGQATDKSAKPVAKELKDKDVKIVELTKQLRNMILGIKHAKCSWFLVAFMGHSALLVLLVCIACMVCVKMFIDFFFKISYKFCCVCYSVHWVIPYLCFIYFNCFQLILLESDDEVLKSWKFEDEFLVRFIRGRKYNMESALDKVDKFCKAKSFVHFLFVLKLLFYY